MGLIGREIIQSRTWDDGKEEVPSLNYREAFPITVFDAVREKMDDKDSTTLTEVIEEFKKELENKQPIFPSRPANYLMTYAGEPGQVGGIQIGQDIPWNPVLQSHNMIPTAKAVGNFMQKLGLIDAEGNPINPGDDKIRWSDIIGRPIMYNELGNHDDGFIVQSAITEVFNNLTKEFDTLNKDLTSTAETLTTKVENHLRNRENPHGVTAVQIGAATKEGLDAHMNNISNPHRVTKEQVGLGNVDNTSDLDKPISTATQSVLDDINSTLAKIIDDENSLVFVKNITYDQKTGILSVIFKNDDVVNLYIPIDGLIDEINYDILTKDLIITELGVDESGEHQRTRRVSLSDLYIRYLGSTGKHITITINGNNITGEQIIEATINKKSITDDEIDDEAIVSRTIAPKAVTTEKIKDFSVTLDKLNKDSVDTIKIVDESVTNRKIGSRAVNGSKLFTTLTPNRILAVLEESADPVWTNINSEMIKEYNILDRHLAVDSVTNDKIKARSVTNDKIAERTILDENINDDAITNRTISKDAVDGENIVPDVIFQGTPNMSENPHEDANNMQLTTTSWVRTTIDEWIFKNYNIGDRIIDGRTLFTSQASNRVLVVNKKNTNPIWDQIHLGMIGEAAISNESLVDNTIQKEKLADKSIENRHINKYAIKEPNIDESAVTMDKIIPSEQDSMVVASLKEGNHPQYTKITGDMIYTNAIVGRHLQDRSIDLSKLVSSELPNRILGVKFRGTNPEWMQVNTNMIEDRAVVADKIAGSRQPNYILATTVGGQSPQWVRIFSELINNNAIKENNIADKAIRPRHFYPGAVVTEAIEKYAVTEDKIAPGAVTGKHIFTSPVPLRVLGVGPTPYSPAEWLQVETEMIKDEAVTGDKLFRSEHPYRVMVATQAGKPPEYQRITSDFIVDYSINPQKLEYDFTLLGTPKLTVEPRPDADNHEIASTRWVRDCVLEMLHNFETLYGTIYNEMLTESCVDGFNLFRSTFNGPRLLGVTDKGEEPEYLLVEEAMIVDGSITKNKVQRDLPLLGSPTVEIRPVANASDATGGGKLIPDCQWVLDRIKDASGGFVPGTSGGLEPGGVASDIINGSISTEKIQDRAVTGLKMFTSPQANMVLSVLEANSDAQYSKVLESMIADNAISPRVLYKAEEDNTVLITKKSGKESSWGKINEKMIETDAVTTDKIKNYQVTNEKIQNGAVTKDKIKEEPFVDDTLLMNNSVNVDKIKDGAVERNKIKDKAVNSSKLDKDLVLDGAPTVVPNNRYETPMLRNVVISPNAPSGGNPGDIWIRYV